TRKNISKFDRKIRKINILYVAGLIEHEKVYEVFQGWIAYATHANTYKYRQHLLDIFDTNFSYIHSADDEIKFSSQKTLQLLDSGFGIKQIAFYRNIKELTVWEHIAKLIEHNQLSVWKVLPEHKIMAIMTGIRQKDDRLTEIKSRLDNASFDEINCVLAGVKAKQLLIPV
ncbi:MAG: helix-turn-helix domain-containing protein, partial [Candidatus Aenigmatarchaeota archaeon]